MIMLMTPSSVRRAHVPLLMLLLLGHGIRLGAQGSDDSNFAAADALMQEESERLARLMDEATAARLRAAELVNAQDPDGAIASLTAAIQLLPSNPLTRPLLSELAREQADLRLVQADASLARGDLAAARRALAAYQQTGQRDLRADALQARLNVAELDPPPPSLTEASPGLAAELKEIAELMARGRVQYEAGDLAGARETFRVVERIDPDHVEAKTFLLRIARDWLDMAAVNRDRSRMQMLEEVAKAWQRPGIYQERAPNAEAEAADSTPLAQKLAAIQIPSISFNQVDLAKVAATLSTASEEYDTTGSPVRGANIVLIDPTGRNPVVSITLRNLSLKRILDFVTDSVGYQYEIQSDAVVVRPGGETSSLDTAFFPVTRSTVIRMTGAAGASSAAAEPMDPFALTPPPAQAGGSEAESLRGFLQQAGVNFDGVPGSTLAYDGSAMIVTQTTRNLERIRNILNRYNDVRQVEIEAKFIEVQAGALEELGISWNVTRRGRPLLDPQTGETLLDGTGAMIYAPREVYTSGGNRTLADAFRNSGAGSAILIDGEPVASTAAPSFPGAVMTGGSGAPLADIQTHIGNFDVNAVLRALSQQQGSDLLSAPKVTVLSGNPANIVVAQELRYPQSYGEIQSQVGSTNSSGTAGSAGVTVTAGTPRDFTSRNIGVELRVTPTVEEDDYSISLDLNPKVTEFEGFVEYGGTSLAISSGRTVTVPPGFYQPIFSVREVSTKVTLWDGATLVMGGLTREEVRQVDDRIPLLGSVPLLGRFFRSKGESAQKRNLLIFVTANLVSPGGSLKNQTLRGTPSSTRFQNPTAVTPAGSDARVQEAGEAAGR